MAAVNGGVLYPLLWSCLGGKLPAFRRTKPTEHLMNTYIPPNQSSEGRLIFTKRNLGRIMIYERDRRICVFGHISNFLEDDVILSLFSLTWREGVDEVEEKDRCS